LRRGFFLGKDERDDDGRPGAGTEAKGTGCNRQHRHMGHRGKSHHRKVDGRLDQSSIERLLFLLDDPSSGCVAALVCSTLLHHPTPDSARASNEHAGQQTHAWCERVPQDRQTDRQTGRQLQERTERVER